MGLFDSIYADGPEFVCPEGHSLADVEFQTKCLGQTMGHWTIGGGRLDGKDGGYGDAPVRPFSGLIWMGAECAKCPAFVQAKTLNLVPFSVCFRVRVHSDEVVEIVSTGETLAAFLAREPTERFMVGCYGPMPYDRAMRIHCHQEPPPPR